MIESHAHSMMMVARTMISGGKVILGCQRLRERRQSTRVAFGMQHFERKLCALFPAAGSELFAEGRDVGVPDAKFSTPTITRCFFA